MVKNTELSTSESVARKDTETPDENVDIEEAMYFDDLTIPGDYSDYDILEEEKNLYPKMMKFGLKLKRGYGEGGYC